MAAQLLDNLSIPPNILVPILIGVLTLAAAAVLVARGVEQDIYEAPEKHSVKVDELWHYPVKGLGGIKLDKATLGGQGFEDDRTFVLNKIHRDEKGEITVYEPMYSGFNLQMVLFQAIVEDREKGPEGASITVTRIGPENPNPKQLKYTGKSEHQIQFPLRPDVNKLRKKNLDMHGSACDVYDMGGEVSAYLTKYLGFETKLYYIGNNSRTVLGSGAPNGDMAISKRAPIMAPIRKYIVPKLFKTPTETITFQDIGQYLVVTKESNDQVSSRLADGEEMDIHKFRPNIIVSGAPKAYDEDFWSQLVFPGDLKMNFGGTCWRCQAITVDPKTGKKAEGEQGEAWKRLNQDRRVDKGWKYGPVFGKYSYTSLKDVGRTIRVGDSAVVTKRVKEQPTFDWPLPKAVIAAFSG